MEVRLLGAHNLESRYSRHTCFLIDGVLGVDAGSLASALSRTEQQQVRALLITHHHVDHTRDIPTLALTTINDPLPIDLYGLSETLDGVHSHLMDGDVYPDFTRGLNDGSPRYAFRPIKPWDLFTALTYRVKAIPVSHAAPSVGYIVRSLNGGCVAYTGDTGGDLLPFFQDDLALEVLFVDVTFPNRLAWRAEASGHFTPGLLGAQLAGALEKDISLPRIIPVHLNLEDHEEVVEDLANVGAELGIDLTPGYEDMVIQSGSHSEGIRSASGEERVGGGRE